MQPSKQEFLDAERKHLKELEEIARAALEANPFSDDADDEDENEWRELAHQRRQLIPLFDAVARAEEPRSDSVQYRDAFHLRLLEAVATVAKLASYQRVNRLKRKNIASKERPGSKSPFTAFIQVKLARNPGATSAEIKAALLNEARAGDHGIFELSADALTLIANAGEKEETQLAISGIASAISKARTDKKSRSRRRLDIEAKRQEAKRKWAESRKQYDYEHILRGDKAKAVSWYPLHWPD